MFTKKNLSANTEAENDRVITWSFVRLFAGFHFFMLAFSVYNLLPHYLELRGVSEAKFGAIAGTMGVANMVGILLLGHRADQWSRKTTVMLYMGLGLAANIIAVLAMNASENWYFLSRALQGFSFALGIPIVFAWTLETGPPARRQETMAWLGVAGLLANSTGPLISETIMSNFPAGGGPWVYTWVFVVSVVFQLMAMLVFFTAKNSTPERDQESKRRDFLKLMTRKHSYPLLLVMLIFGGLFGVFISFGKNYAVSIGLNYVSVLFSGYTVGAILSRVYIGPLTRKLTPRHMIFLGLLGIGISMLGLSSVSGYLGLALVGGFYGLSHGILYPTVIVRFIETNKKNEMGRATILVQGAFSGGWGLFPYIAGLIVQFTDYQSLFYLLTMTAGGGILIHLWSESRHRHQGMI